jgi:Methylamine utilisation protein MauE
MLVGALLLPWSAIGAGGAFLLFGFAVGLNLLRGRRDIPCGCFSLEEEHQLNWWMVARNGVFVCLTAWVAVVYGASFFGWHWSTPSVGSNTVNSWSELFCTSLVVVSLIALWWLSKGLLVLSRLPDPSLGCKGCGG